MAETVGLVMSRVVVAASWLLEILAREERLGIMEGQAVRGLVEISRHLAGKAGFLIIILAEAVVAGPPGVLGVWEGTAA
jgi:hypothetical protein